MAKTKKQRLEEKLRSWSPEDETLAAIDPGYFAWHHRRPGHSLSSARRLEGEEVNADELTVMLKSSVNPILLGLTLVPAAITYALTSIFIFFIRCLANLAFRFLAPILPEMWITDRLIDLLIWLADSNEEDE